MKYAFNRSYGKLAEIEGGLVDHPSDSGGETAYGWTWDTAKEAGWKGLKKDFLDDFTKEDSKKLVYSHYWEDMKLGEIAGKCDTVAFCILQFAFHKGKKPAQEDFQKALNLFNRQEKDYKDIKEDGIIGTKTISAFNKLVKKRGNKETNHIVSAFLTAEHGHFLNELASKREKDEDFMVGWYLNRIKF